MTGTVQVKNRIEIRGGVFEDTAIVTDARALLESDHLLYGLDVRVRVRSGRVRILGRVPDEVAKMRAGQLVSYVRGVQSIENDLEVAWSPKLEDAALGRRVHAHLASNAETAKVAKRIRVKVKGGVVRLEGNVLNWAQWHEAGRVALLTDGVKDMENRLEVLDPDRENEILRIQALLDQQATMRRYRVGSRF